MKVFKEEQYFRQLWLIILLSVTILMTVGIILNEFLKENTTMSMTEFISVTVLVIFFTTLIFFFKLKTRIDEKGIHYQFFPFHLSLKLITWSEISKATVRTYDPISEYGGWGLKGRFRRKSGRAINIRGNVGIQLELKNGKKLLIGTQKENEVKRVLNTYSTKI